MTGHMTDAQITQADREAAWKYRPSCYKVDDYTDWMAGNYDMAAAVIGGFARHRLATRTDATPVAWMDLLANAYAAGAEDVHKAWIEGTASSEPDFGEAASDYAHSIDFPPATDVAALVEALEWIRDRAIKLRKGTDDWFELVEFEAMARQALTPFTKGQP